MSSTHPEDLCSLAAAADPVATHSVVVNTCRICFEIPLEPTVCEDYQGGSGSTYGTRGCPAVFCKSCLEQALRGKRECPNCRQTSLPTEELEVT